MSLAEGLDVDCERGVSVRRSAGAKKTSQASSSGAAARLANGLVLPEALTLRDINT